MEHLWRLLTAIFIIAASVGLFVVGWIFSGGGFHDYFTGLSLFVDLAGIVWGICRGISAIISYNNQDRKKET